MLLKSCWTSVCIAIGLGSCASFVVKAKRLPWVKVETLQVSVIVCSDCKESKIINCCGYTASINRKLCFLETLHLQLHCILVIFN